MIENERNNKQKMDRERKRKNRQGNGRKNVKKQGEGKKTQEDCHHLRHAGDSPEMSGRGHESVKIEECRVS